MHRKEVLGALAHLESNTDPDIYTQPIIESPFRVPGKRANSVYVGDTAFGDSGKGIVTAEFNRMFVLSHGRVYSIRFNGGANAGHHMFIDGTEFLANQLPAVVAQRGGVGLITRGMVLHPSDAVMEVDRTKKTFGGEMPGELLIDDRVPLCLDTHRAQDTLKGSTGRGIGPAYSDFYMRRELTMKDLMADNWGSIFKAHYQEKRAVIAASLRSVMKAKGYKSASEFLIKQLDNTVHQLGRREDFLGRLAETREQLRFYVESDMRGLLQEVWANEEIPVTIEEAQGPGLDPYAGIRPDVSSSRPTSRSVHDGTWMVIYGEQIGLKVGVSKTEYLSSVGARWLPGEIPSEEGQYLHDEFGEYGKTTGRERGLYYLSLPILRALRRFADYDYLVATHIDAAKGPIKIVSHFTDSETGEEADYSPYQDQVNRLVANYIEMPGWDGPATSQAKVPADLDVNARRHLYLLSETVAPVIMARNGQDIGNNIRWWNS